MNKMTVIQLLNKIANGEEVPKKIKYNDKIYEWKEYDVCYEKIMTKKGWVKEYGYVAEENRTYFYLKHCYQNLNDTVEILEEPKGIPEKLDHLIGYDIQQFDDLKEYVEIATNDLFGKANKIIDTLNQLLDYLESKGE